MHRIARWLKDEVTELMVPTMFFFVTFQLLAFTKSMSLDSNGISLTAFATATIGALLVGKAVLIADHLPWINRFPSKALIYNVVWKTLIYLMVAFVIHYLEELIPFLLKDGNLATANRNLLAEASWPHFWLVQAWLFVLLIGYTSLREVVRVVGSQRAFRIFFISPEPPVAAQ